MPVILALSQSPFHLIWMMRRAGQREKVHSAAHRRRVEQ